MTIIYNGVTGGLSVHGPTEFEYSSILLEIEDDPLGKPAEFSFRTGMATWLDKDVYQVLDLPNEQGFVSIIGLSGTFTFSNGDEIGGLLPSGLPGQLLSRHVHVSFNAVGIPGIQIGEIVPEPPSFLQLLLALLIFGLWARSGGTISYAGGR